jgi:pullulanase
MNIDCPHCQQNLEVDDGLAGKSIECPSCHHVLTLPRSIAAQAGAPSAHVPLQPIEPQSKSSTGKRRPLGCNFFFWSLLLLLGGGFGYAMYRWQASPQETLKRLVTSAQNFISPEPTPLPDEEETAAPEETPAARAQATPRPDPLTWLIEHKEQWPNELVLLEPVEFPAVSGGKVVGSLKAPAGSAVKVLEITPQNVAADYMGGTGRIAIAATDLLARAEVALTKAEREARQDLGKVGPATPSRPKKMEPAETIREATRDEISKGLGALYTRQATTFRVFAPTARVVSLVLYDEAFGDAGRKLRPLRQQPNGLWDLTVTGNLRGKFYTYLLDGNDPKRAREVLDPYAVNAVANSTRGRITPMTTGVSHGPRLESPTDAIIYEMHVRDFTVAPASGVKEAGLYLGWTEEGTRLPDDPQIQTALDHLTELGVTHVELMPVEDFENDEASRSFNWGYITSAFFSPEGMFASNPNDNSRVRELKALISTLHVRGMSVIMDVVYNHTSGKASLMSIAPEYYYRRNPDGSLSNGSGCGNEFKSESPMGRRLIVDSLKYWAKEYGVDGFRFDLMALIDQETMREADRELRAINPGIVLFGEPWTGGNTPLRDKTDKSAFRKVPAGAFNDDFRNALKGSPDGNEPGWIQNGSKRDALKAAILVSDWFASPGQSINYMTCHDNLVLWDKLVASMPSADDTLRIETMKLGYLALFTSQGVPFFHGGEEFARSKGGNNNSYESPDSVNEVDWSLKREHLDLFNYVRDLISMRKAHPMFRLRTRPDVRSRVQFVSTPDPKILMFTINGEGVPGESWKRVCVIMNSADNSDSTLAVTGEWIMAMDAQGAAGSVSVHSPFGDGQSNRPVNLISGNVTVRHKSGMVLFQQ